MRGKERRAASCLVAAATASCLVVWRGDARDNADEAYTAEIADNADTAVCTAALQASFDVLFTVSDKRIGILDGLRSVRGTQPRRHRRR